MNSANTARNLAASVLVVCALILTACSSSSTGGANVSQSQLEAKLKKESSLAIVKTKVGAAKFGTVVTCIAKTLKKDANSGDLENYVKGNKSIDDIGGNSTKAKSDVTACIKTALIGG